MKKRQDTEIGRRPATELRARIGDDAGGRAAPDFESAARRLAAERRAMEAARDIGRGERVEVEIVVGRERITLLDRRASAPPLYAVARLTGAQRAALIVYGAVIEELASPGGPSELGVLVSSGSAAGGGAVDRRLSMIELRDLAWAAIGQGEALSPIHRARPSEGAAELGPKRSASTDGGAFVDPRRAVSRRALADAVCRDGASICTVLRRHGWKPQGRAREQATQALVEIGQDIADAWNGRENRIAGASSGFTEVRAKHGA